MTSSFNNLMNVGLNTLADKTASTSIDTNLLNNLDKVTNFSSDGKNGISRLVSVPNGRNPMTPQVIPLRSLETIAPLPSNGEVCNTIKYPSTKDCISIKPSTTPNHVIHTQSLHEKTVASQSPTPTPIEPVSRESESSSTLIAHSALTASAETNRNPLTRTNLPVLLNASASRQLPRVAPTLIAPPDAEAEHFPPTSDSLPLPPPPDVAALDVPSPECVPMDSIAPVQQLRQALQPQASTVASPPAAPLRHVTDSVAPPASTQRSTLEGRARYETTAQALLSESFASVLDAGLRFSRSPCDESSTDGEFDLVFEGLVHDSASLIADSRERRDFIGQNLNKTISVYEPLPVLSNAANGTGTQQRLALIEATYQFIGNSIEEEMLETGSTLRVASILKPARPNAKLSRGVQAPTVPRSRLAQAVPPLVRRLHGVRATPLLYTTGVYRARLEQARALPQLQQACASAQPEPAPFVVKTVPMSNAVGSRVNPLEVLYPMLQPSRFFARVLGFGFSPEARRALFLTEYVEGDRLDALGKLAKDGRVLANDLERVLLRDMVLLLHRLRTDHVLNMDFKPENFVLRSCPGPTPWSKRGLVLVDHGFAVLTDSNTFATRTYELARGTALYLTLELAEYVVNVATGKWPRTKPPPLTPLDDQVGAALTLAAVLLGEHPWTRVLQTVQVPRQPPERSGEFFTTCLKRVIVSAEQLSAVLEAQLNEALKRGRISATARDVILALYYRKPLNEVAKLVPNLDTRDADC